MSLEKAKILIVEDDESLRVILCAYFEKIGSIVFSATNGAEAFQIALIEDLDIILSDIKMPTMDGLELIKSLHGSDHKVPLLWLMTGQFDVTEAEAIALGAKGIIFKPFKLKAVHDQLLASFEHSKA